MSFKSLYKSFRRALPTIIATAPVVIAAIRQVKRAAKDPMKL